MRSGVIILGLITGLGGAGIFGGCGFRSPACETFGSQVDTCTLAFSDDLTLSGMITYDTATHELRVNGAVMPVAHTTLTAKAGDVDAIFASNVRLVAGAQLRATGVLPFAIVASGSVTLEDGATIDVGNGGAGARQMCASPPMPGSDDAGGAGGGGGGGYGAAGGAGGGGNQNQNDGPQSTGGAEGSSIAMPAGPLGGCPGARGGTGHSPGGIAGPGGLGGGALYLVAADHIELGNGAVLTAGGGGGRGGGQSGGTGDAGTGNAGGGGGGSGGMIFLESRHVIGSQSQVAANGGGGGEGSEDVQGGNDGAVGTTSMSRAPGGANGTPKGADGGRGGSLESAAGETVTMLLDGGGGGGGGGVGFVHVVSPDAQLGSVSPAGS